MLFALELFAEFGSAVADVTAAVLVTNSDTVGVTETSTVTAAPPASGPRLHVTTPEAWPHAALLTETNDTLAGRVSTSVTPVACDGPLLVTVIEYVAAAFTTGGAGRKDCDTERSATPVTT